MMTTTPRAIVDLSPYRIAQNLVERAIRALEHQQENDGMLGREDTLELRRAYVLRNRLQGASLDAVEAALDAL